jgi:hypothetical protein
VIENTGRMSFGEGHEPGIDPALYESVILFNYVIDVGLIDAVKVIRQPQQVRANSFLQFRSVFLNPSITRRLEFSGGTIRFRPESS